MKLSGGLGCYTDTATRDLPHLAMTGTITIESCVSACATAGYSYAGVEYGRECYCGNAYGKYGTATDCTLACTGNSAETCGGVWANDVYPTKKGTLGCYTDTATRDLPHLAFTGNADRRELRQQLRDGGLRLRGSPVRPRVLLRKRLREIRQRRPTATRPVRAMRPRPAAAPGRTTSTLDGIQRQHVRSPRPAPRWGTIAGSVSDGCGGTLSCGTCTAPKTCGGGGTANVCGEKTGGSGTCAPTAAGPGGAGSANVSGSNVPAFPSLGSAYRVTGLDTSGSADVGAILQQAMNAHAQIIIPGSGSFGAPYRYNVKTQVNVPSNVIIECETMEQSSSTRRPAPRTWRGCSCGPARPAPRGAGMYGVHVPRDGPRTSLCPRPTTTRSFG